MRLSALPDANGILHDSAAVADRYRTDGCLLVRGLLDPTVATALAAQATTILRDWQVADTTETTGATGTAAPRWTGRPVGARDWSELDTVPALTRLVARFTDPASAPRSVIDRIAARPMHLWRNACFFAAVPDDPAYATKPHQDGYALSGTGDYRRVWIALTPIPFGDGGLAVATGSHRAGRLPQRTFPQHRVRPTPHDPEPTTPVRGVDPALVGDHWHTTEFHPGDALIFHTDLVHRGLWATSDRIRLALAIITSGETDPRPAVTYTKAEMRERRATLHALGATLGLSREQLKTAATDLIMTGLPVTEDTLHAALAGGHAGWRDHSPTQRATRSVH